jgi:hypothetical protein
MADPVEKSKIPPPADMLKTADLSTPEKILSMMKDYAAGAIRGATVDLAGTPVDVMNLLISPVTKALGIYSEDPVLGSRDLRKRTGQPLEDTPTEMAGNILTPGGAAHAMIVGAARIGKNVDAAMAIKERVTKGALEAGKSVREATAAGNAMAFVKEGVYWDKGEANAKAVISDAAVSLNPRALFPAAENLVGLNPNIPGLPLTVGNLTRDNHALMAAYPEIRNLPVNYARSDVIGSAAYQPGPFRGSNDSITIAPQNSKEGMKGTLSHEVQHAIQDREKFNGGSNVNRNRVFTDNTLQALVKKGEELGMQKDWSSMSGQPFSRQDEADALSRWTSKAKLDESRAFAKYSNNPGEQEARFTQQNTELSQSQLEAKVLDLLRQGKSPQSWDTRKIPDAL